MGEALKIVEGTWDELQAHAEDFRGRKLRLVVLSDSSETDDTRQEEMTAAILRMFAKADRLERSPSSQSSDPQKQEHQAILDEKYRAMGFEI